MLAQTNSNKRITKNKSVAKAFIGLYHAAFCPLNLFINSVITFLLISLAKALSISKKRKRKKKLMKKIITVFFSFILLTYITACTESPNKLYGVYKDINEKRDILGYVTTLTLSDKVIEFNTSGSIPFPILPPQKDGDLWIAKNPNNSHYYAKLKEIAPNTIEYYEINNGKEDFIGTFIKITEGEFKHIQETPKVEKIKELPLF